MPRVAKELSALAVKHLKQPGMHAVGVVPGLHLQVSAKGGRSWVLRVTMGRRNDGRQQRREIGLGGYPAVTLQQARDKAREIRQKIDQGIDPVAERETARAVFAANQAAEVKFEDAADQYIEAKAPGWSAKSHQQWTNTLTTYAYPFIGELPVGRIEMSDVLRVLQPIWATKTETAKRLRGRIEKVLGWATVKRFRAGPNPAAWKDNLDVVLPSPGKVMKKKHQPALRYVEVAEFLQHLRSKSGMGSRALEFAVLTAARSGEARGARWEEIDFKNRKWTIPADRMKPGREHTVPLPDAAIGLLKSLSRVPGNPLVFVAPRGGQLSDATLGKNIKELHDLAIMTKRKGYIDPKVVDGNGDPRVATLHGFRSTFRDWASEEGHFPHDVTEMALSHVVGSQVELAYRRGDMFQKRRALMQEWAEYCYPSGYKVEASELKRRA